MEMLMLSTLETTEKSRYWAPGALHSPPMYQAHVFQESGMNPSLKSLQSESLITAAIPDVFTSKKCITVVIILTNVFSPLYHNKHITPQTFASTQQEQH